MDDKKEPEQIGLELPNYFFEYEEWSKNKEKNDKEETIVIIDLF